MTLRPECNHAPKKINNNNTDITEPKAIANAFNNFFAKIGNDIANSVPNTDCIVVDISIFINVQSIYLL